MSGPPAEPATKAQASRRHAGRRSLLPSISSVAAAVAPRRSWHVKPAAAYTKDVRRTQRAIVANAAGLGVAEVRHSRHADPTLTKFASLLTSPQFGNAISSLALL